MLATSKSGGVGGSSGFRVGSCCCCTKMVWRCKFSFNCKAIEAEVGWCWRKTCALRNFQMAQRVPMYVIISESVSVIKLAQTMMNPFFGGHVLGIVNKDM